MSTLAVDSRQKPTFVARGAAVDLITAWEPEILYEGPANTGKTRTVLEKCYMLANEFPGCRMLWVRKTRKSMTESVLVTWEEHVLPPNHPCSVGGAGRANRDYYEFPNGTRIVLGGMDNPDRIMSTEYDIIVYFEATEGTLEEWEKLGTRVRNKRIIIGELEDGSPRYWDQMIADCNPSHSLHWLNKRAQENKMRRICARHSDNPVFTPRDQARLDALSGARRARLRDGKWVSAEGQIWEQYDVRKHHTRLDDWLLDPTDPTCGYKFEWYFAGLDFGKRHAQALEIFGCYKEHVVRVGEIYRRNMRYDWWGDAIARAVDLWDIQIIIADNSDLSQIDYLNDRLGPMCNRDEGELVQSVMKKPGYRMANIEIVRDHLADGTLLFADDALLEGACNVCAEQFRPQGLLEELPDFRWAEIKDGRPAKEQPDPLCVDHGIDAMLMALGWRWGTDLTPQYYNSFAPGTYGDILDHESIMKPKAYPDMEMGASDEYWPIEEYDEYGNLV
jgi:hypothetical protein